MKKQLLFFLIFSASLCSLKAQTVRTDVLVVGNGNAAMAAGLQAAISGVKTTILLQAGGFDLDPISGDLNSGLQTAFLKKVLVVDSNRSKNFNKQIANAVLKKWTDSTKNLTVIENILWVKADKSGNNWNLKLNDGSTIKAKILINAAESKLNDALNITSITTGWKKLTYDSTSYRTSIAAGRLTEINNGNVFSLYDLLNPNQENFLWINDSKSMLIGQAAGATAAYAAFFKSKTSLSNLKTIQGELLNYKLNLMPFEDIMQTDSNWKAIQMVGVTGILKANLTANQALFLPDQQIAAKEIEQPLKDFFYKAQLWFDDYKNPLMTLESTLALVCYVGNKSPESTKKEVEKKWKITYNFKSDFDLNKPINRREFAVLLQDYMPPFNVNINPSGKVVR